MTPAKTNDQVAPADPAEVAGVLDAATRDLSLPEPESFAVNDARQANWLVRRIVESRQYREHVQEWAAQELKRAEADEARLMYMFGSQLRAWASAEIEGHGGRRKSVALPAGTVGFRTAPVKLIVDDEKSVVAWAKTHHPEMVVVVEQVAKSALNDLLAQTGEIPEAGVHIEPAMEKFFVK